MKTLKKTLCLVLSVVMLVGVLVIPANAANKVDELVGADKISDSTKTAMAALVELGIMEGDEEGLRPQDTLTRAEGAALIARAMATPELAKELTNGSSFTDVPEWCGGVVSFCYQSKVALGDDVGLFNPDDELTAVDFAAMVLRAAGSDDSFTGVGYENRVIIAAANSDPVLTAGTTKDFKFTDPITRENAAQLLFNAMQIGEKVTTTETVYKIVLKVSTTQLADDSDGSKLKALLAKDYETLKEALAAADTLKKTGGTDAAVIDTDYVIIEGTAKVESAPNSLGYRVFGMQQASGATADAFGRTTSTWEFTKVDKSVALESAKAAVTYTTKVAAADLKDLKVSGTVSVIVDGVADTGKSQAFTNAAGDDASKKQDELKDEIVKLSDYTRTLELYTNKDGEVNKIIVINYHTALVSDVATDGVATLAPAGNLDADSKKIPNVKKGDVISYTQGVVNGKNVLQSCEVLTPVIGKLAGYTADTYTVGTATYALAGENTLDNSARTNVIAVANFTTDMVYYVNKNNAIVGITAVPGAEPEVITDYCIVLKGFVTIDNDATGFEAANKTVTAQLQVLTSAGTVAVYDLPLTKAADNISGDDNNGIGNSKQIAKDEYYVKIGDVYYAADSSDVTNKIDTNTGNETADTSALSGKVFAYKLSADGKSITLAEALTGTTTLGNNNGVCQDTMKSGDNLTSTTAQVTLSDSSTKAVVNADTVVILEKDGKAQKVSGLAGLGATTAAQNKTFLVLAATKGDSAASYVVKYVFVTDTEFTAAASKPIDDYVFISGAYTVNGTDKDDKPIYSYEALKVDGTTVTLTSTTENLKGIYTYKSDNSVGEKVASNYIDGKTVSYVGGSVIVTSDDTAITYAESAVHLVGTAELKAGATIYAVYDGTSKVATLIFVVAA